MKTFKQFLYEANHEAYGWLNPKGSFIRNRGDDIHGDTYSKFGGPKKMEYYDKIDHAINKGWQRIHLEPGRNSKTLYGVIQGKEKHWTKRHAKAIARIRKALAATDYEDAVEKY